MTGVLLIGLAFLIGFIVGLLLDDAIDALKGDH